MVGLRPSTLNAPPGSLDDTFSCPTIAARPAVVSLLTVISQTYASGPTFASAVFMREVTSPQPLEVGNTLPGLNPSADPQASFRRAIISMSSLEKIQDM